eukprot:6203779-Pleurochrysis_carterae.AAC.4
MESDLTHFAWKNKSSLDVNATGPEERHGTFIFKHATFRPVRKKGTGLMHHPSHTIAIHASWSLRYSHPRVAQ